MARGGTGNGEQEQTPFVAGNFRTGYNLRLTGSGFRIQPGKLETSGSRKGGTAELGPMLGVGPQGVNASRREEMRIARSHHYRFGDGCYPHFLTCAIVGWLPVFTRPACVEIVFDSLQFLQRERRFRLLGYVVMENHLHLIARSESLSKDVSDFKSFTARRIIDRLRSLGDNLLLDQLRRHKLAHKQDREYQLWQEGSHPQQIETDAMLRQKLGYIHENPVKRGYVDDPCHWRYSSARNYAKMTALIDVDKDW